MVNVTKSSYLTFTLRKDPSPPLYLNEVEIPPAKTVKYLGLHLDTKLIWRDHVTKKRKQMVLRCKELYWLLGRSFPSQPTINSYKTVLQTDTNTETGGCTYGEGLLMMSA
jgi:hypothetical protein